MLEGQLYQQLLLLVYVGDNVAEPPTLPFILSPPTSPMPPAKPLPANLTSAFAAAGNDNKQTAPTAAPASAVIAAAGPLAEPALADGDRCEVAVRSDQGAGTIGLIFKNYPRSGALLIVFNDGTWKTITAEAVVEGEVLRVPHDSESRKAVGHAIRSSMDVRFPEAYLYGPKQQAVVTTDAS
eukprot:6182836-Pleurochrysis_carterae.AAC.2